LRALGVNSFEESKVKDKNILICGFMGCGKSYFLNKLKNNQSSCGCFDVDDELRLRLGAIDGLGKKIEEIGWNKFRAEEKSLLSHLFKQSGCKIIGLGGGAFNKETQELILGMKRNIVIWINTPFEICYERIREDTNRPLVKKGKDFLFDLYKKREKYYSLSHMNLNLKGQNDIQNFQELLVKIKKFGISI
jgi:shikimate kinase